MHVRRFLKNNGLTITLFGLFLLFLVGQAITGYLNNNNELTEHGQAAITLGAYLHSGEFVEAVFENWESEFLQMGSYVVLTIFLFQKGSPESEGLGKPRPHLFRGGFRRVLYDNSLGLAFLVLFLGSLLLHAADGAKAACQDEQFHGGQCESTFGYMTTSQFWFESFQNWQSEFLAVGTLALLSIFLRQKGSPESNPVR